MTRSWKKSFDDSAEVRRHLIATVLLLPIAFALERMSASMYISCVGLSYASATSASAVANLLPVLTFFLAVLFRMESLNLWKFHGLVKMSGIVLCSVGVVVLGLYQGPELKSFIHYHHFHYTSHDDANSSRKWILGTFLQSLAAVMWALWAIRQGRLSQEYPSKLFNITLQIAFATAQSFFMTLVIERDFSRWKLRLDVGLAAIVYCLCFLMCSVLSGVLMVGGLYNVLWGKRIEQVAMNMLEDRQKIPCLDLEELENRAPVPTT
ncbi:hypothetical protein PR202_gb05874 [Eleusine coracana subsp. coracana]|uniref:WAT1-related protein n=1 Tax=Eleusine coracana subsp. coracana TaxID=191504 RepID=A0AAV5E842_ELECO|nr:hypothetical protein PR202_gb05874 [Eleusine coracana subsp. coracana]